MNKNLILVIFLFLGMTIFGCTKEIDNGTQKEELFLEMYPNIEFNTKVILQEDPFSTNLHLIGSDVNLVLINQSDTKIEFSIAHDLEIYIYSEKVGDWITVNNQMNYGDGNTVMQPKGSDGLSDALVYSWPDILNYKEPNTIRVVAIGHVKNNGLNDERVGAYFDITLLPSQ